MTSASRFASSFTPVFDPSPYKRGKAGGTMRNPLFLLDWSQLANEFNTNHYHETILTYVRTRQTRCSIIAYPTWDSDVGGPYFTGCGGYSPTYYDPFKLVDYAIFGSFPVYGEPFVPRVSNADYDELVYAFSSFYDPPTSDIGTYLSFNRLSRREALASALWALGDGVLGPAYANVNVVIRPGTLYYGTTDNFQCPGTWLVDSVRHCIESGRQIHVLMFRSSHNNSNAFANIQQWADIVAEVGAGIRMVMFDNDNLDETLLSL